LPDALVSDGQTLVFESFVAETGADSLAVSF
jgi:hypothetical protein